MNDHLRLVFAPLLPHGLLVVLAVTAALLVIFALTRGARGAGIRGVLFALFLLAFFNPSVVKEQRAPLKDTAIVVLDESASMRIGERPQQAARVFDSLTKKLSAFDDLDTETIRLKGASESDLFAALAQRMSAVAPERLAGVIAITDGEIHDKAEANFPAPFHALIAGHRDENDRRLSITQVSAYGLVGKKAGLTLRVDDAPRAGNKTATVTFQRDGGESETFVMPVGEDFKFEAPITHPGPNLFAFSTEALDGELTPLNNSAAVTVSGIRDRLRVLLVSGEPHIGGRTWRNFLKADPAVDLVHFTILRSPAKADLVPNNELALIAFPVRELFETKLQSFDLVIFDRFRQQSLVPDEYLENIAKYVERGGALLVSNATGEGVPPLTFSPLARVLPTEPTGRLLTGAFVPDLSEAGRRHPVTGTLEAWAPRKQWGPWFRQSEAKTRAGEVLMTGLENRPLLVLAHIGEGRVAQFLSDQFWLWAKGYQGGGPQAELLRRVAHWLVSEPELDETALRAHVEAVDQGWQILIEKRSLRANADQAELTGPGGKTLQVGLHPGARAGVLEGIAVVSETSIYHVKDKNDDKEILVLAGPENAPEFGDMRATDEKLKPVASSSGGGIFWLADHPNGPEIRRTEAKDAQQGWNWIGLKKNGQYRVTGSKAYPLWPAWLLAIVLLGAAMLAWRHEGKS